MAADVNGDLNIKVILYGQSIDNVLSALIPGRTHNHNAKVQQFKELFPDYEKLGDLDKAKDLWMDRRYGQAKPPENDFGIQALCSDLVNFAVKVMAAERKCSHSVLWAEVANRAEATYSLSIRQWKSDAIPSYIDFDAFKFVEKIREDCRRQGLVFEHEFEENISGLIHIQVFGLPRKSAMTETELARLSSIFKKMRLNFDELRQLRDRVEYRNMR